MLENGAKMAIYLKMPLNRNAASHSDYVEEQTIFVQKVADNLKKSIKIKYYLKEKEILKLIAEGLTSAEIGKRLFISTTTVDTHRKHLLEKLKAGNTAILIKTAVQLDLIPLEFSLA